MKIPQAKKGRPKGFTKTASKRYSKRPSTGKAAFAKSSKSVKPEKYQKTFVITERKPRIAPPSTLRPGMERLERHMAHTDLASRREAKALITQGVVSVNGKVVREPGFGINPEKDIVTIQGANLAPKETMMLFKPRGVETNATNGESDIRTRYPRLAHLSPIGRLDKDSSGLILLSTDGTLARAMTKEDSTLEKEYLVTVREQLTDAAMNHMAEGIVLDGVITKPAIVTRKGRSVFSIVLTEGRKHQIRRMCDACHLTITTLVRIRIGHLKAASMIAGNVKSVSPKDVAKLKSL